MQRLIIGDIHGCYDEFQALLDAAGLGDDDEIIALGDIVDRGPDTPRVLAFFAQRPNARSLQGNHERKHTRGARGELRPALSQLISQWQVGEAAYPAALAQMEALPVALELPEATLVHGFWEPGRPLDQQRESVLVGTLSGEGYLERTYPGAWYEQYDGPKPLIVGHRDYQRTGEPLIYHERVYALDTGCCVGGRLTGLLLPAFRLVSVPSQADHWRAAQQTYWASMAADGAPSPSVLRARAQVRDALLDGALDELLADLSATARDRLLTIATAIERRVASEEARLRAAFADLTTPNGPPTRKEFAAAIRARSRPEATALFALFDGQPPRPLLLRAIDLADLDDAGGAAPRPDEGADR